MRRLAGLKWIIPAIRAIQLFSTNLVSLVLWPGIATLAAKVGMTGTARIMRIMLAGQLLGCIGTGRLVPNTGLTGIGGIGQIA